MAIGGRTPLVSQVKKIIFLGWGPTAGKWAFGRKLSGKDVLAFGVIETSAKLIFLVPGAKLAF